VRFTWCGNKLATRGIQIKLEGKEMPLTREEMKVFLSAEADAMIEKIITEREMNGEITLDEIEEMVIEAGREFQTVLTEAMIEAEEGASRQKKTICPECGEKMRHRGYRDKPLVTRTGEVILRRAYYRCETCGRGFFPPGSTVGAQG
jgi:uncharacterized protein with PIN domain